jgi:hypothetical protein
MRDSETLRRQAAQARRAASVRTEGGFAADRQLLALAQRLERDAAEQDRKREILDAVDP